MHKNSVDILIFNYADNDGSGNFMQNFANDLIRKGHSVELIVAKKYSLNDYIHEYESKFNFDIKRKVEKKLNIYKKEYEFYNRRRFKIRNLESFIKFYKKTPKIIICSWTSILVSLETITKISDYFNSKLYLWPLDKAHFFGGCHYNISCLNYNSKCISCPAVPIYAKSIPKKNFLQNKKLSKKFTMIYHTPWLKKYVKKLTHLNYKGFEFYSTSFKNYDFLKDHTILNKPKNLNSVNLLYGASNTNNPRKGFYIFKKIIKRLDDYITRKNIEINLNTIGNQEPKLNLNNINHFHCKYINNENELIQFYKKNDIIISTTLDDFGPSFLLEAMMCGNIPISFKVGHAFDIIKNKKNGLLIENFNINNYTNSLIDLIFMNNSDFINYRRNGKEIIDNFLKIVESSDTLIKSIKQNIIINKKNKVNENVLET